MSNALPLPNPYLPGVPGAGLGDDPGMPERIQQNMDAIAIKLGPLAQYQPTRVSALPTSPFDGQEIYYVADSTNGVMWHFKYRLASASSYKWEYVGGPGLFSRVDTYESLAAGSFGTFRDLATAGPAVTAPLAGDYQIEFGATGRNSTAMATWSVSPSVSGGSAASALAADAIATHSAAASADTACARTIIRTGLTAAAITLRYAHNNNTGSFASRWLSVVPVRVG